MIETLRLENVAIVERAELAFGPGLNVLTGETGAGKSIVLGALTLVAGGRASLDAIRDGSDEALAEAVFRTERLPELEAELARRGLAGDPHELVVQRSLSRTGRGLARIAGQRVPVSALAELFAGRVEISSQHDSQSLLRPESHGRLLDRHAGLAELRERVGRAFAALRDLDDALIELRAQARERARRSDTLAFQVAEIDAAKLDAGLVDADRSERERLAHAERLREQVGAAAGLLAGDPLRAEDVSAADLLAEAARHLQAVERHDPQLAERALVLRGLAAEARDAALELQRYAESLDADPGRLTALEERLQRVEQLQRKYGASVEEVLALRDEAARELAALEDSDARASELARQRDETCGALATAAGELSLGRGRAARRLARAVQAALRELAMPQARFEVALEPSAPPAGFPCGPTGAEVPAFRFSANAGEPLRPLNRIASGGELSRTFLAIKNALREADAGMVLVFDEVDAGVGGRAANRVGRGLAELARHHQVLCITHLPQIAAHADRHFRVEKQTRKGRTLARITRVEGPERVEEIARMAGGERVGEATRRHARELLGQRALS